MQSPAVEFDLFRLPCTEPGVRLGRYPLLVADEVGSIRFDAEAANLFLRIVSSRYERASLTVPSNKPFGRWCEVFGHAAAAMIDRLAHTPKSSA